MSSIDYELRKIKAFAFDVDGVLSPATIPMDSNGEPMRMINIKDGYVLQLACKIGYKLGIFTGGRTEAVRHRFNSLGIRDVYLGAEEKLPLLRDWMAREGLQPEEVVYVGDDIPDLPCLQEAGLPCAPADAAWEVKEAAIYVSRFNGGYGVARDIVEQVMRAQGVWIHDKEAFGW